MQIVSMPSRLIEKQLLSEVYSRNFIAAQILPGRQLADEGVPKETIDQRCREIAQERTDEYVCVSGEIGDKFLDDIIYRLNELAEAPDFQIISGTFLRQTLVLVWNSFEVFCRDMLEQVLNAEPYLVDRLRNSIELKKLLDLKNIPLETLQSFDFNVSNKMGTILIERSDFSQLHVAQAFLAPLTTGDEDASKAIFDDQLYYLNRCRNLVVHRRGIVDAKFKRTTKCNQEIGEELDFSVLQLEMHARNIAKICNSIVKGVSKSLEDYRRVPQAYCG